MQMPVAWGRRFAIAAANWGGGDSEMIVKSGSRTEDARMPSDIRKEGTCLRWTP